MLPSSSDLTYFLAVAETLNMSRAAERLGISQPALTFSIKRIESTLGAEILIRGKAGVRLTRAGLHLVTRSRLLLGEWERLKSDLSKDEGEISGYYSLGCHVSVGMYTLHHFLPSLLRDNPRLQINLTHDLSRKITEAVIDFKLDVGLVVNPIRHPDLVIKPLFEDAVCLWTSTKRFNSDVLIYDPELMQSQHIIGLMAKEKLIFDRTITSGSLEIIRSLISSGAGVGILPSRVARLAEPKSLTPFREKNFKFFDKISLIYRSDLQKSAGSRLLITAMAKILEQV